MVRTLRRMALLSAPLLFPVLVAAQQTVQPTLADQAQRLDTEAETYLERGDTRKALQSLDAIVALYSKAGIDVCGNGYPLGAKLRSAEIKGFGDAVADYRFMAEKCGDKTASERLEEAVYMASLPARLRELYHRASELSRRINKTGGDAQIQRQRLYALEAIIKEFPESELTPFAAYVRALVLNHLLGNVTSPFDKDEAGKMATNAYKDVASRYPKAVTRFKSDYLEKGVLIAPYAQYDLADLEKSEYYHNPDIAQAIFDYKEVIKKFPGISDCRGGYFDTNAYVQMLLLYSDWQRTRKYSDPDKAKETAYILLQNYPNRPFLVDWYFGKTHPEALITKAELEAELAKKTETLLVIAVKFGDEMAGKDRSDAVLSYGASAFKIVSAVLNPSQKEDFYMRVLSSEASETVKHKAEYNLAVVFEEEGNSEKAKRIYKTLLDELKDGDSLKGAVQRKLGLPVNPEYDEGD